MEQAGVTPADLFARMTPHQLAAVALRRAGPPPEDRVADLAAFNRRRAAAGLRPTAPSWYHPSLRPADG